MEKINFFLQNRISSLNWNSGILGILRMSSLLAEDLSMEKRAEANELIINNEHINFIILLHIETHNQIRYFLRGTNFNLIAFA